MFDRFNPQARYALERATSRAMAAGSESVEPEHLLASLAEDGESSFSSVISDMNLPRRALAEMPPPRPRASEDQRPEDVCFSAESRRVLAHTVEEADRLGHKSVGTSHFLLGLLRGAAAGDSARFLRTLASRLEDARAEVKRRGGEDPAMRADLVPAALFFELDRRAREAESKLEQRVEALERENRLLREQMLLLQQRLSHVSGRKRGG